MRAMGVGEHDVLEVGDGTPHLLDHLGDEGTIRVVESVDEGETVPPFDEEGVHVSALFLTETKDPVAD